jgi:hypothetical protein
MKLDEIAISCIVMCALETCDIMAVDISVSASEC